MGTWESMKDQPEIVGEWVEEESREVRRNPSTYAADWEILRTKPGRYQVRITSIDGKPWGSPYFLDIRIDADRVGGKTYSGFGGVNFASKELSLEPKTLFLRPYAYQFQDLVDEGRIIPNEAGRAFLWHRESR